MAKYCFTERDSRYANKPCSGVNNDSFNGGGCYFQDTGASKEEVRIDGAGITRVGVKKWFKAVCCGEILEESIFDEWIYEERKTNKNQKQLWEDLEKETGVKIIIPNPGEIV